MTPPNAPDPDAGWLGLTRASLVVLAPLLILVGIASLAALYSALRPTPPELGPIATAQWTNIDDARADAETAGWSEFDKRAVSDAADADVRRLEFAVHDAADQRIDRTGIRTPGVEPLWLRLEAEVEAEMQKRGLRRDTTFRPFPPMSASHAALWTYRDWAGNRGVAAVALIDVPRPSTGTRVRSIVEVWTRGQD